MKHLRTTLAFSTALAIAAVGCDGAQTGADLPTSGHSIESLAAAEAEPPVIRIVADHSDHQMEGGYGFWLEDADGNPVTEIPSGWTTFELDNDSHSTHSASMFRVPQDGLDAAEAAGQTILDHWYEAVTEPFQQAYDPYHQGDAGQEEFFNDLVGRLLASAGWFFGAAPAGGPGFTAGLGTSRTTIYLEPGTYILQCYVKNGEGLFHSYMGMLSQLSVTQASSGAEPPTPSIEINLATEQVVVDQNIRAGAHVVAVHFDEQDMYEHLLGHDIHLIRMDRGTSVAEVGEWMSWLEPSGLISASGMRGPQTFLGGVQTMTAGSTGYFHVELEPGLYAWVSEVPDPHKRQMLHVFNVPGGHAHGRAR